MALAEKIDNGVMNGASRSGTLCYRLKLFSRESSVERIGEGSGNGSGHCESCAWAVEQVWCEIDMKRFRDFILARVAYVARYCRMLAV
jgi:hypothetical protein